VEPLVIVGVGNAGDRRIDEYTPTRDARRKEGGGADLYGRFLLEELIPFVDTRFPTDRRARARGLGGSSLGGLVSLYLALRHPGSFGKVAVLSPSVWWDRNRIVREVRALPRRADLKIWLDIGTEEGRLEVKRARLLRDALLAKGWRAPRLRYLEALGAVHDEAAWGDRAGDVLEFLFPVRPALSRLLDITKGDPRR
jgi:predicted alpha/beta superfamily hydrolase